MCRVFVMRIWTTTANLCESIDFAHDTQNTLSIYVNPRMFSKPFADATIAVCEMCLFLTGQDLLLQPGICM
ncbi:hypothetical protein SELSPUOL_01261 [Selenomonas sputigena ATCC 35185]|nr:hypothetical protein SELSPUOL_01261 [Selenomonas sputigena ATCC 35185]